jgi:hypothetical protein
MPSGLSPIVVLLLAFVLELRHPQGCMERGASSVQKVNT